MLKSLNISFESPPTAWQLAQLPVPKKNRLRVFRTSTSHSSGRGRTCRDRRIGVDQGELEFGERTAEHRGVDRASRGDGRELGTEGCRYRALVALSEGGKSSPSELSKGSSDGAEKRPFHISLGYNAVFVTDGERR